MEKEMQEVNRKENEKGKKKQKKKEGTRKNESEDLQNIHTLKSVEFQM